MKNLNSIKGVNIMRKFFDSKFCKVFEKYWRLIMFVLGFVLYIMGVIQHDTVLNLCATECYVIIMIPRIVNDTLEALKND